MLVDVQRFKGYDRVGVGVLEYSVKDASEHLCDEIGGYVQTPRPRPDTPALALLTHKGIQIQYSLNMYSPT